jgi:hypothetical protein
MERSVAADTSRHCHAIDSFGRSPTLVVMRVAVAVIIAGLNVVACGAPTRLPAGVPADQFCAALVEAACDRELRCGRYTDRVRCRAEATDALDACPLDVQAVALLETGYNAAEADRYMDALRGSGCETDFPDPVDDIPVFTPMLDVGAVCHSDVSCTAGLSCQDVTVADPQGVCTAGAGV